MGYRSTFVTTDTAVPIPPWFYARWSPQVHFAEYEGKRTFPISSRLEYKRHGLLSGIEEDIQKVLAEANSDSTILLVWMGEDGALTQVAITAKAIVPHALKDSLVLP
jgi:hypothetical protein